MTDDPDSPRRLWVWISLSPESTARIRAIRAALAPALPPAFAAETNPHVSVLPGVTLPRRRVAEFRRRVADADPGAGRITVDGIDWHPPGAPYAVTLDVTTDLSRLREALATAVRDLGGELAYDPVDPHVTLFKTGDDPSGERLDDRSRLRRFARRASEVEASDATPTRWSDDDFEVRVDAF